MPSVVGRFEWICLRSDGMRVMVCRRCLRFEVYVMPSVVGRFEWICVMVCRRVDCPHLFSLSGASSGLSTRVCARWYACHGMPSSGLSTWST